MVRAVSQFVQAVPVTEGAGVNVLRSIGTPALKNLDPFLMLDHFSSNDPDDYIAGFPPHPHRGFITFTYMLDGHMEHQDSMGNRGDLRSGGAQWMKAASGVIHSEMPRQTNGLMRGFQLWINLPSAEKMSDPAYQEFAPESIPEVCEATSKVRVLAGEYAGVHGVVHDSNTQVCYLDIHLRPGAVFVTGLNPEHVAFIYVYEGELEDFPPHTLSVLGAGHEVAFRAGSKGARFILVTGRPIREPIVQHGPFVMNTRAEIEQAFHEYQAGTLVRKRASMNT